MASASIRGAQPAACRTVPELLEQLSSLLAAPVDAASFESVRAELAEMVAALRSQLQFGQQAEATAASAQPHLDAGLPGRVEALAALEQASETSASSLVATIWVERVPL